MAAFEAPNICSNLEISLTLNNLLDERGLSNYYAGALVPNVESVDTTCIHPRTLTLRIAGRF